MKRKISEPGTLLVNLRQSAGWTQAELARRAGVSKPYICQLEAGQRTPSLRTLRALAKAFSIPLSALLED